MNIINKLSSFFSKKDYEVVETKNDSEDNKPKKIIKNNTEITTEENLRLTKEKYDLIVKELSEISKKIEIIENKIQYYIDTNDLSVEYYYSKQELKELVCLYKEKELESFDRKKEYYKACKLHYIE